MKQTEQIQFKRERELGDILTDTFKFVRHNFKPLCKVFYKAVGPVFLVAVLAFVAYNYVVMKGSQSVFSIVDNALNQQAVLQHYGLLFFAAIIMFMVISILYYAVLYATLNFSVQSYIKNDGEIQVDEVSRQVRQNWSRFFGLTLLSGLIVGAGCLLCFLPGIYLYVPMSLVFSIMVFQKSGVGESISYSFKLIKHNWWMSFFTLFIMGIIYYMASAIFGMPATIYTLIKTMFVASEQGANMDIYSIYNWPYVLLSIISIIGQLIMYVLMTMCAIFIYFNLNEKHNQTGAYETIESLGESH